MADIVERLRAKHNDTWPQQIGYGDYYNQDGPEAADEIERLKGALDLICDGGTTGRSQSPALNMPEGDWLRYRISDLGHVARTALKVGEG